MYVLTNDTPISNYINGVMYGLSADQNETYSFRGECFEMGVRDGKLHIGQDDFLNDFLQFVGDYTKFMAEDHEYVTFDFDSDDDDGGCDCHTDEPENEDPDDEID